MAIRVEFIRRRAGGRVTRRPTFYEKTELSIGRATDCDVYLPDLRVALHHAKLTLGRNNRVTFEALGDYRLKINGSTTRRGEVSVGDGADVRIGPYKLAAVEAEADKEIAITIELVEPPKTAPDPTEDERFFSMLGYAPDKRLSAWAFVILVATAFLVIPILSFAGRSSDGGAPQQEADPSAVASIAGHRSWLSGEVSSAHANIAADCNACHKKAFTRVEDSICLDCHNETRNHAHGERFAKAEPVATGANLWLTHLRGQLGIPEGRCGSCHFEHNGPDGVSVVAVETCTDCHVDMDTRLPDTALLNVGDFDRTHPQFRATVAKKPDLVAPELVRVSLDDKPQDNNGLKYPHDFHLNDPEVIRKLATLSPEARAKFGEPMDCAGCHVPDSGGLLFAAIEMEAHCEDCHSLAFDTGTDGVVRSLPHGRPKEVRQVLTDFYLAEASATVLDDERNAVFDRPLSALSRAQREKLREDALKDAYRRTEAMVNRLFSEDGACHKCHTIIPGDAETGRDPDVAAVYLTNRFLPKAYFPHDKHVVGDLDCGTCHAAETSNKATDVLLPSISVCRDCHGDSHDNGLIESTCLTCHGYHDEDDAPLMTPATAQKRVTQNQRAPSAIGGIAAKGAKE